MRGVYTKYFQKSKVFIYPLLGIKKGIDFVPENTYMCWDTLYNTGDYKLICSYIVEDSPEFRKFEERVIFSNKHYHDFHEIDKEHMLYAFDLSSYKNDINLFLQGKYSKLSDDTMEIILNFFGDDGQIAQCVLGFLFPEEVHDKYAEYLDVDIDVIKKAHEVCTPPDMSLECCEENIPFPLNLVK